MPLRRAVISDIPQLMMIWERAVRATHHFLPEEGIAFFRPLVRDCYLPTLEVWVSESSKKAAAGFMALTGARLDMLFIDPAYQGQGHGCRLVEQAVRLYGPLTVDVNEQNETAVTFYMGRGFRLMGGPQQMA
ncbi:putative acetyltransferase [Pseudomonas duriflava]|uniref:Putative acetyltransferase n=1 Tax=Pseudomonas duriflava TaxID=459528 RepID=A0A562QDX2_9PSED|nr:putative acetyltransferase [Pseudomonas duriflava]